MIYLIMAIIIAIGVSISIIIYNEFDEMPDIMMASVIGFCSGLLWPLSLSFLLLLLICYGFLYFYKKYKRKYYVEN
jgi:hypothetical protein